MAGETNTDDLRDWLRGLGISTAGGAFLALAGAFGSGEAPLPLRLAYWVGLMMVGAVWGHVAGGRVERRGWLRGRPWAQAGLMIALIAPPLTVGVWLATALVFGFPLRLATLPGFFPPVLMVSAVMTAVSRLAARARARGEGAAEKPRRRASSSACRSSCAARSSTRSRPRTITCGCTPRAAPT